jgi:hypothetical protein
MRPVPVSKSLHATLDLLSINAPTPASRSGMKGGGALMQAQASSTKIDHDGILTSATAIDRGDGPRLTLAGRTYHQRCRPRSRTESPPNFHYDKALLMALVVAGP